MKRAGSLRHSQLQSVRAGFIGLFAFAALALGFRTSLGSQPVFGGMALEE